MEGVQGVQEESFGLVLFGEAKFLGELMCGEDGAFGIKAELSQKVVFRVMSLIFWALA